MTTQQIEIPTPDGVADAYFVHPDDGGHYPGIVFYMDGIGLRPTLVELAQKVAGRGYCVLLPNLFYRRGKAPLFDFERFASGEGRDEMMAKMRTMIGELSPDRVRNDSAAFLDFLSAQLGVQAGKMATTGYCMGGAISLRTAGYHPHRVAAAASFHGGNLATQSPDSPHLLADRIKAELYIGHAKDDHSCLPEQIEQLEAAFQNAGVRHQSEVYDARHGWTMPDLPAYNQMAAEKAWHELFGLLLRTFQAAPSDA